MFKNGAGGEIVLVIQRRIDNPDTGQIEPVEIEIVDRSGHIGSFLFFHNVYESGVGSDLDTVSIIDIFRLEFLPVQIFRCPSVCGLSNIEFPLHIKNEAVIDLLEITRRSMQPYRVHLAGSLSGRRSCQPANCENNREHR